jgi:Domain of unknown function (DUF5122) beta-propeller
LTGDGGRLPRWCEGDAQPGLGLPPGRRVVASTSAVGGDFETRKSQAGAGESVIETAALLRLLPNGVVDPSLDPFNFVGGYRPPTDNRQMWEVAVQPDGKYLIVGTFTHVAGVPRKGMAQIIVP